MVTLPRMSSECHETAAVTKILPNNRVQVVVKRSEACGACSAKGACQALGGQTKDYFLELDNPVGAIEGDTVRLTISESAVVQASAILYLLPALCLIGFALLGNALSFSLSVSSDLAAVIGALLGLGIGFFATWVMAKRAEKSRRIVPVITSLVETNVRPG